MTVRLSPSWLAFSTIVLAAFVLAIGYQCARPVVETVVVQETPTLLPVTVLPTAYQFLPPSVTPTVAPTETPFPTALPTATPTPTPTETATPEPSPTRVPVTPVQRGSLDQFHVGGRWRWG